MNQSRLTVTGCQPMIRTPKVSSEAELESAFPNRLKSHPPTSSAASVLWRRKYLPNQELQVLLYAQVITPRYYSDHSDKTSHLAKIFPAEGKAS